MSSDEIRKKSWEAYGQPYENPVLVEIAAQLAEINEWLRTPQSVKDAREAQINGGSPNRFWPR